MMLECPFCGSRSPYFKYHSDDCFIKMRSEVLRGIACYTEDEMVDSWNTRHSIGRCEDCKFFHNNREISPLTHDFYEYQTCGRIDMITIRCIDPDGFCAWFESKE